MDTPAQNGIEVKIISREQAEEFLKQEAKKDLESFKVEFEELCKKYPSVKPTVIIDNTDLINKIYQVITTQKKSVGFNI